MFNKIRSKLVHSKMFAQRSMSWIAIVNSGMILFLVLSQLERYGYDIEMRKWFLPIFIITVICLVLFGYIEDKLGFYAEETRISNIRNPQMEELLKEIKDVKERIQKIEKRIK